MTELVHWNGTTTELDALLKAIANHCTCDDGQPKCPAHTLMDDQRIMNHLAFVRANAMIYELAEWAPPK